MGKTIKFKDETYLVNDLYSTTEKRTGTWIDGKPVYKKVIEYTPSSTIGNTSGTTLLNIAHNISSLDTVVDVIARTKSSSGNYRYTLPYILSSGSNMMITNVEDVTNTNIQLRISFTTWTSSNTFYFIVKYTKTTD